jgi:hypothetical protein
MAFDMQAKSNTHVWLAPIVVEAMLLIKQEGIVGHAPQASSASSVSSQLA